METKISTITPPEKAVELLLSVVDWWENWNFSDNPTEIADPPIEEIKKFLHGNE